MKMRWGKVLAVGGLLSLVTCGQEERERGRLEASQPANSARDVEPDEKLNLVFSNPVSREYVEVQEYDGPCEVQSIMISKDGFLTCVGGDLSWGNSGKELNFVPRHGLAQNSKYRVKLTPGVGFTDVGPLESTEIYFTTHK